LLDQRHAPFTTFDNLLEHSTQIRVARPYNRVAKIGKVAPVFVTPFVFNYIPDYRQPKDGARPEAYDQMSK
jgi:hypothetical protein